MDNNVDLRKILRNLPPADKDRLLRELLRDYRGQNTGSFKRLELEILDKVEDWLLQRSSAQLPPRLKSSRLRLWFIFMFLRYGALRLDEIFRLRFSDINFSTGNIHIAQPRGQRVVPLPPAVIEKLKTALRIWPGAQLLDQPLKCDPSRIRRAFAQCASACGMPQATLNARSLRRQRCVELEIAGLTNDQINLFIGRPITNPAFDPIYGLNILRQTIQQIPHVKTSARNTFYGQIIMLETRGILVHARLEMESGLKVEAIITETSRQSLHLEKGMLVTGLVKAPWVSVSAPGQDSGVNHFRGKVLAVKSDEQASEILVGLPQGNLICALNVNTRQNSWPFQPDDPVTVSFSPLSVILSRG